MARTNAEDCWWSDPRRSALIRKTKGSAATADGIALNAWRLAQEFWKNDHSPVPRALYFTLEGASELIEVGLAEDRGESGVYVRGSSAYLEWVYERREAAKAAGKKSAETKKARKKPVQPVNQTQPNLTKSNQTQPSGSGSYSEEKNTTTADKPPEAGEKDLRGQVQEAYAVWGETLKHFDIQAGPMNRPQESSLARAIAHLGFETVLLALEGQRYEQPGKDFNPSFNLSMDRVLHKDRQGVSRWEKFKNLALAARAKAKKRNHSNPENHIAEGDLAV